VKRRKLFLMVWMVVMIGTMVRPVFADVYDLDPMYEANRSRLLISEVGRALKDKAITQEEADLIFETDPLFAVTNEQRRSICIEACKWALAKNLDLAKDPTIPLEIRQKLGFIQGANRIKTAPGLKQAFSYDDVDLSLYNGSSRQIESIRRGIQYTCHIWVLDCYLYGYFKVKERDLRKAAKLWGYSFEEFAEKLSEPNNWGNPPDRWLSDGWQEMKRGISGLYIRGVTMHFDAEPEKGYPGHAQMTLGEFGYTSNGSFHPNISEAIASTASYHYAGWSLPLFGNPIIASLNCLTKGKGLPFQVKRYR